MNERELDRAIDAAAGRMMAREPSRALGHNVMARVRENPAPARRSLAWVAAAAGIVLCAAIATAADESVTGVNRSSATGGEPADCSGGRCAPCTYWAFAGDAADEPCRRPNSGRGRIREGVATWRRVDHRAH